MDPNVTTRLFKSEEGDSNVSKTPMIITGFEDERGHNQGMLEAPRCWKGQEDVFFPGASRKGLSPHADPCWLSKLQNYKIIELCYCQPLSL